MSAAIAILIFEQSYGGGKDSERCSSPDAYLETELSQYKKIVAEQTWQIHVLKDVIEKKL